MADLQGVLSARVDEGELPGAVALVARGDHVEVAAVGSVDVEGTAPMTRDSIFRVASITKPLTAAAVMMLVDDGVVRLDDRIDQWLPELASPAVVRTPESPVDDVVPAARPITVLDLLTFRAGWGFPDDFTLPAVQPLFAFMKDPLTPHYLPGPDEWLAGLSRIPLLHQPGEVWLYNTCSDIQGVLVARASGQPFAEFLAERLFSPLGMSDTGFHVPASATGRFTNQYQPSPEGGLVLHDAADGPWTGPPAFASGAGGLVSTLDDWLAFGLMLLAGGVVGGGVVGGRRVLSAESARLLTTDHLTPAQRQGARLFLEGQGWGFGGSVDVETIDPWNVPGRYGWVGGSGTSAHVVPSTGSVSLLLTPVALAGPTPPPLMREFWRYAADG